MRTVVRALLAGLLPLPLLAQEPGDTVVRAAGAHYRSERALEPLTGSNWRVLWTQPVRVPVLDLRAFAGGLKPERRGGGNQSITLHLTDASGRSWIFRSIDKFPGAALPPELRGTAAGDLIQDHISVLHPAGHFVLPPLLAAVGVLHAQPQLFVMPDDPLLGEFREQFAGMLGELEERPNEGPDNTPGFAGSRAVKGTDEFLEDLVDSQRHRLREDELLRARLVDFLVGDPDRGTDQWRWARFEEGDHYVWRPVPVDRDWALVNGDGLLARAAAGVYPKLARFGPRFPSMSALTFSSHVVDRRLLTRLTRADFTNEAVRVQHAISDDVIEAAIAALPPEYAALNAAMLRAALRARRDRLPEVALAFHRWLAGEVDVHGTDEADHLHVERRRDGSVRVLLTGGDGREGASAAPWYERVFDPRETREVRIYLLGGDDHARVTGSARGPVLVRVIGGDGEDLLMDEAGGTRFYDDAGGARVTRARGTRFDPRPYVAADPPEGLRMGSDWVPDWGGSSGVGHGLDYSGRHGVLLGMQAGVARHGFRRRPHHWELDATAWYAPATSAVGLEVEFDYALLNSRRSIVADVEAWRRDVFRFHGFGNSSEEAAGRGRVFFDRVSVMPALQWQLGRLHRDTAAANALRTTGTLRIGPAFAWTDVRSGAPPNVGSGGAAHFGGRATLDARRTDRRSLPRRGVRVNADAHAWTGDAGMWAHGALQAAAYVPLIGSSHLALRAGGARALGEFPAWAAATVGGRASLRGFSTDRYAGDAALYGTAELRVPVDTINVLVRTELGLLAFGDAGRVWYDAASPGGWHTGVGGGVWLAAFGRSLSAAVAAGDGTRAYLWFGLPF